MLALSRRVGQEIVIGDPANPLGVIRIVAVHGDKARMSFKGFDGIQIHREEVAKDIVAGIPHNSWAKK